MEVGEKEMYLCPGSRHASATDGCETNHQQMKRMCKSIQNKTLVQTKDGVCGLDVPRCVVYVLDSRV